MSRFCQKIEISSTEKGVYCTILSVEIYSHVLYVVANDVVFPTMAAVTDVDAL